MPTMFSPMFFALLSVVLLLHTTSAGHMKCPYPPCDPRIAADSDMPTSTRANVKSFMKKGLDVSLFGDLSVSPASASELVPYKHPKLVMNEEQWTALLDRYADLSHFSRDGSWSKAHRMFTWEKGPLSDHISKLSSLDTSLYTGDVEDLSDISETKRMSLQPLADLIVLGDDLSSGSLFMCTFWAMVNEKLPREYRLLPENTFDTCKNAAVAWSKIVLTHRAYNCGAKCPSGEGAYRAYAWDHGLLWSIYKDSALGLGPLTMFYDIAYSRLSTEEGRVIRSAISLAIMNQESWGTTEKSTRNSPNAAIHPHRIFSNWATYHSFLYLANLVVEEEHDLDVYASAVIHYERKENFPVDYLNRFTAVINASMHHTIYPDGSTAEDGYTYIIALREGSLGILAAERRGLNFLGTDRFRALIHNLAQITEPWQCGRILGHASGGGIGYPAYAAFFRYLYPNGPLTKMIMRQRFGEKFLDNNPCRVQWFQNMMQMTFLGLEHDERDPAESFESLERNILSKIPTSYYAPRRGLLIARNGFTEKDAYIHFDARPDSFFIGHENADRGVFTFSACRQTWLIDYPEWRENIDSRKHSVVHVDGLAQDEKAPPVKMLKTEEHGDFVVASANLTYAYNVQWAKNWPDGGTPTREVSTYQSDGLLSEVFTIFPLKEVGDPRNFGWPARDEGADIGLARPKANLWGDDDLGFKGMYTWKRKYRTVDLSWAVRSVALIRSTENTGYLMVADSFSVSDGLSVHKFESYLMLDDDVDVSRTDSYCIGGTCFFKLFVIDNVLDSQSHAEIHVVSHGSELEYRIEKFTSDYEHMRIVIVSDNRADEEMFIAVHGYTDIGPSLTMSRLPSGGVRVRYGEDIRNFQLDAQTHSLDVTTVPTTSPEATASATPSNTVAPSPSVGVSPSPEPSESPSPQPMISVSPSTSPTGKNQPMPYEELTKEADWFETDQMSADRSEFFLATGRSHQIVFKIYTKTIAVRSRITEQKGKKGFKNANKRAMKSTASEEAELRKYRLTTCHRRTVAITDIAVYDCGEGDLADGRYYGRDCYLLFESLPQDGCKKMRTVMRRHLETGRAYFVVVSASPITRTNKRGRKFVKPLVLRFMYKEFSRRRSSDRRSKVLVPQP